MQGRFIYLGKSLSINCNYVPYYVGNGLGLKREGFCRGFAPLSIITRQGYFQLNGAPPPRIPRHTTPARFNETWSVLPWLNPCHPFSSSFLPFRVRPPPFLSYYLEKLKLDSHGLTFRFSLLPLANRKIRPATGWKLRTSFLPVTGKQRGKEIFYFGISNDLETRRERERERRSGKLCQLAAKTEFRKFFHPRDIHMVDNNAYAHNYQRNTMLRNTPPSLAALREFYNATVVLPG